ncbi:probable G-protein coupled receptor 171 [Callorhinchus milii]|uniref:G protein-coupled receptor 171 n=1 Tax=Callorhinchus milii TaxID=7868 RepID=V9KGE7_CALMI|nr:probable G-protein coupled receptor 171 [Callorhinchus milii]XP_007900666.1 probable G-protein coupled receptor 171 [Callorhinchus milii]|eukprot:gi/632968693/ref/XP_007900665.1/ PREDICTED: probable G-protein coupled receptor 171 [Callorhinchus milii]
MTSDSSNTSVAPCVINNQMEAFTYFYYLIFLIGIIGSFVALWAFISQRKSRKSLNIFLLNLLTADFLLTLALPFKIAVDLGIAPWSLKIFHCQFTACLIYINMYSSIIFLGFVSMDRYIQLSGSLRFQRIQEPGFAKMISVAIWCVVLFLMVPNMVIPTKTIDQKPLLGCAEIKTTLGLHWHVLTNFICMAIFMNASVMILTSNFLLVKKLYANKGPEVQRDVRQSLRHIFILTAMYIICFVPYHIVRTPYTLSQYKPVKNCALQRSLFLAKESTLLLAVLNLCFDPILYFYLCKSFRSKITETFGSSKATRSQKKIAVEEGSSPT